MLALGALSGGSGRPRRTTARAPAPRSAAATESLLTALNYARWGAMTSSNASGATPRRTSAPTTATASRKRRSSGSPRSASAKACWRRTRGPCRATASGCGGRRGTAGRGSRLGNPTGDLSDPTVTMHTVFDPLVIVQNERLFAQRVSRHDDSRPAAAALRPAADLHDGNAPYGAGHCNFSRPTSTSLSSARSPDGCPRAARPTAASLSALFAAQPGALDLDYKPARGRLDKERTTMRRTAIGGAILAVIAFLLVLFGQALESRARAGRHDRCRARGAVVALVPDRPPLFRARGFRGGFLVGWGGYALRAGVLPDTSSGRALAALVVLLLLMAISVATVTRVPLWSLLTGPPRWRPRTRRHSWSRRPRSPTSRPRLQPRWRWRPAFGYLAASFLGPAVEAECETSRTARAHRPRPAGRRAEHQARLTPDRRTRADPDAHPPYSS